jgi:hypothetical protein
MDKHDLMLSKIIETLPLFPLSLSLQTLAKTANCGGGRFQQQATTIRLIKIQFLHSLPQIPSS